MAALQDRPDARSRLSGDMDSLTPGGARRARRRAGLKRDPRARQQPISTRRCATSRRRSCWHRLQTGTGWITKLAGLPWSIVARRDACAAWFLASATWWCTRRPNLTLDPALPEPGVAVPLGPCHRRSTRLLWRNRRPRLSIRGPASARRSQKAPAPPVAVELRRAGNAGDLARAQLETGLSAP